VKDSLATIEAALDNYQEGHFGILEADDLRNVVSEAREGRVLYVGCDAIVGYLDDMGYGDSSGKGEDLQREDDNSNRDK
jgi:hypothetical protein